MADATRRLVSQGELLPPLVLSTTQGERVTIPSNQATILIFTHPERCPACDAYLVEAATAAGDIGEWATRLVGIRPGGEPPDALPFAVATDPEGTTRRRLGIGEQDAAVLLADRWGEVFEVATFDEEDHTFPLPRQLVESSKIIDISCGECNVPSPEWRQADAD